MNDRATPEPLPPPVPIDAEPRETLSGLLRKLGPAGPLAAAGMILPPIGGILLFVFLSPIGYWLRGHQELGVVLYVVSFAVLSGFAFLPTYAQAALGGWAFGRTLGLGAALFGFVSGALLGYFIGRFVTGPRVLRLIDEHPKWRAVFDALLGSGFWRTFGLITLIRLNSPFALVNFFFGATRTNLTAYVLGTVVGLTPRTAAAVYIATGIQELTGKPESPRWLIILSIVAALIVVVIISKIANDALTRFANASTARPASA